MRRLSERQKRLLILAAKLLIVVLVVWGVQGSLRAGLVELSERQQDASLEVDIGWLLLAGVFYLAALLPSGLFWHRVLVVLGERPRIFESLRAYYIGHLGKYVPGKAMVVVLRVGLIRTPRVDTTVAAVAVFYETLTMMAVGAFLAAAIIAIHLQTAWWLSLLAVAVMATAGLPTLPPVFRRIARRIGAGKAKPEASARWERLSYPTLLAGWLGISAGWCLMGLSLWATLQAVATPNLSVMADWPLLTAATALAVVLGFLSLIPGGILVREAVLLELLGRYFGDDQALIAAVLLRLVWLVAELLISSILYIAGRARATEDEVDQTPSKN